jgi:cold-inducible RNA-binding protein
MTIYAGNLSPQVNEDDLRVEFRAFGIVNFVNIVKDRRNTTSMRFGFIEMPVQDEAEAAIATLHGKRLKGTAIIVNEARPRPFMTY